MAINFTQQQLTGLNAAYQRKLQGTANAGDLKNLEYAIANGYKPPASSSAPAQAPTPSPSLPTPLPSTSPINNSPAPSVSPTPTPASNQSAPSGSVPINLSDLGFVQLGNGEYGSQSDDPTKKLNALYSNVQKIGNQYFGTPIPGVDSYAILNPNSRIQTYADGSRYDLTTGKVIPNAATTSGAGTGSVYLKDSNGSLVPFSSKNGVDYQQYLKAGYTPADAPGGSTTSNQPTSTTGSKDFKSLLQGLGIDVGSLSDQQVQTLGMMAQVVQTNAQNDAQIAPKSLSQQDLQSYFDQAKSQIDPYYQDQFSVFKQDLLNQVGQITGELPFQEQAQEQAFKQQQEGLAKQQAELGLAQSGIRKGAEQQLQTQQEGAVRSNRRQLQQQIYQLGSQAERLYGAQGASLVPSITSQGYKSIGVDPQKLSYTPSGVQYPTAPQQEQTDIINRQTQLAQQELAKRNFLSTGAFTQI